jgi:sarcosine oxidase gamma subunit
MYPTFEPGQKVRTIYGKIRTVLFQCGCQVFVVEESNGWYHPTKVWPIN